MLFLITNRKIVKNNDFYEVIKKAIEGGVDSLILREKDLSSEELENVGNKIKRIIDEYSNEDKRGNKKPQLIINGNRKVAEKIGADGYHLGFRDFIESKRTFKGLLGASVHNVDEAVVAEQKGANYVLASHIFPTKCKEGLEPKGIKFIEEIKSKVSIPVIALGGINQGNAKRVMDYGADGVAVMSYIMSSDDPYKSAQLIKRELK